MKWNSVETIPKKGEFILAVWEGDWRKPRQNLGVYHAHAHRDGYSWSAKDLYRTCEGEAYEVAGWIPLPEQPK